MTSPKIVIFNEKNLIKVTATIETLGPKDGKVRLTLKEIESYLNDKNIKYGKCLKSEVLTNGVKSKNIAEWVFEKNTYNNENIPKKKVSKKRKIFDLPIESKNAIIEENETSESETESEEEKLFDEPVVMK